MIFGNKEDFAIESQIDIQASRKSNLFGSICIWINGKIIGDADQLVLLNVAAEQFSKSLKFCGLREPGKLEGLPAKEIFEHIEKSIYGEPIASPEDSIEEGAMSDFWKYNVCEGFSESFDGFSAYLLETKSCEYLIWKSYDSELIFEYTVEKGTYSRAIHGFLGWFQEQLAKNDVLR